MLQRSLFRRSNVGGLLAAALAMASAFPARAQPVATTRAASRLTCTADRVVIRANEAVTARAWATTDAGEAPEPAPVIKWTTSTGKSAEGTTLKLSSNSAGELVATASLAVAGSDAPPTCSITITVAKPQPKADKYSVEKVRGFVSGHALLPRGTKNPETSEDLAGFGVYSYLLFSSPPSNDGKKAKKYQKVLEAYLRELPAIDALEENRARSHLNITFVPVVEPSQLPPGPAAPSFVAAILNKYDYARAKVLLDELGQSRHDDGPYLIATLPGRGGPSGIKVMLDMTGVDASLVADWVKTFCWLVAAERSWDEAAMRRLQLNVRNVLSITARRVPELFGVDGLLGLRH